MTNDQTASVLCQWEGCESVAIIHLLYFHAVPDETADKSDNPPLHADLCAAHASEVHDRHGIVSEKELGACEVGHLGIH